MLTLRSEELAVTSASVQQPHQLPQKRENKEQMPHHVHRQLLHPDFSREPKKWHPGCQPCNHRPRHPPATTDQGILLDLRLQPDYTTSRRQIVHLPREVSEEKVYPGVA